MYFREFVMYGWQTILPARLSNGANCMHAFKAGEDPDSQTHSLSELEGDNLSAAS